MNRFTLVTLLVTGFLAPLTAAPITITFDPTQATPPGQTGPPPGAETAASTLSYWGVTFKSTASDNPDICGGAGPLCFGDVIGTSALGLMYLTDDVLSGSLIGSSTLTLTFANPTAILDFGAVVGTSTNEPLSVALSGPQFVGTSPQTITLSGTTLSEGEFTYSGSPITQAVITFSSDASPIFAIDNLTYQPQISSTVPEPESVALFGVGLLCLVALRRFRTRSASIKY